MQVFGCRLRNQAALLLSLDRDCLPSPSALLWVGADFHQPSGTMQSSDFYWAIGFRLLVLRPTALTEPSRSHWVKPRNFVTHPSPLRLWHRRISGVGAACRLTRHGRLTALHFRSAWSRTYGFHQTPPRGSPQVARAVLGADRCSGQRPCHIGVGFPSSGPRVRICLSHGAPPIPWSCQSHTFASVASGDAGSGGPYT